MRENRSKNVQNPNTLESLETDYYPKGYRTKNLWKVFTKNLSDWKVIKRFSQNIGYSLVYACSKRVEVWYGCFFEKITKSRALLDLVES